jgi:hypothetical protein
MNEKRKCVDCLHCKVVAKSSKGNMFCVCKKRKNKIPHLEIFWEKKNVCQCFNDMLEDD